MTKKQFISIFSILVIVSIVYIYNTTVAISSRSKCADYAMNLVTQSLPDSFVETRETFPPKRLKAEASQDAKANYNFFYDFCMNKKGVSR